MPLVSVRDYDAQAAYLDVAHFDEDSNDGGGRGGGDRRRRGTDGRRGQQRGGGVADAAIAPTSAAIGSPGFISGLIAPRYRGGHRSRPPEVSVVPSGYGYGDGNEQGGVPGGGPLGPQGDEVSVMTLDTALRDIGNPEALQERQQGMQQEGQQQRYSDRGYQRREEGGVGLHQAHDKAHHQASQQQRIQPAQHVQTSQVQVSGGQGGSSAYLPSNDMYDRTDPDPCYGSAAPNIDRPGRQPLDESLNLNLSDPSRSRPLPPNDFNDMSGLSAGSGLAGLGSGLSDLGGPSAQPWQMHEAGDYRDQRDQRRRGIRNGVDGVDREGRSDGGQNHQRRQHQNGQGQQQYLQHSQRYQHSHQRQPNEPQHLRGEQMRRSLLDELPDAPDMDEEGEIPPQPDAVFPASNKRQAKRRSSLRDEVQSAATKTASRQQQLQCPTPQQQQATSSSSTTFGRPGLADQQRQHGGSSLSSGSRVGMSLRALRQGTAGVGSTVTNSLRQSLHSSFAETEAGDDTQEDEEGGYVGGYGSPAPASYTLGRAAAASTTTGRAASGTTGTGGTTIKPSTASVFSTLADEVRTDETTTTTKGASEMDNDGTTSAQRIKTLEADVADLTSRLSRSRSMVEALRSQLDGVAEGRAETEARLSEMAEENEWLKRRVEDMERKEFGRAMGMTSGKVSSTGMSRGCVIPPLVGQERSDYAIAPPGSPERSDAEVSARSFGEIDLASDHGDGPPTRSRSGEEGWPGGGMERIGGAGVRSEEAMVANPPRSEGGDVDGGRSEGDNQRSRIDDEQDAECGRLRQAQEQIYSLPNYPDADAEGAPLDDSGDRGAAHDGRWERNSRHSAVQQHPPSPSAERQWQHEGEAPPRTSPGRTDLSINSAASPTQASPSPLPSEPQLALPPPASARARSRWFGGVGKVMDMLQSEGAALIAEEEVSSVAPSVVASGVNAPPSPKHGTILQVEKAPLRRNEGQRQEQESEKTKLNLQEYRHRERDPEDQEQERTGQYDDLYADSIAQTEHVQDQVKQAETQRSVEQTHRKQQVKHSPQHQQQDRLHSHPHGQQDLLGQKHTTRAQDPQRQRDPQSTRSRPLHVGLGIAGAPSTFPAADFDDLPTSNIHNLRQVGHELRPQVLLGKAEISAGPSSSDVPPSAATEPTTAENEEAALERVHATVDPAEVAEEISAKVSESIRNWEHPAPGSDEHPSPKGKERDDTAGGTGSIRHGSGGTATTEEASETASTQIVGAAETATKGGGGGGWFGMGRRRLQAAHAVAGDGIGSPSIPGSRNAHPPHSQELNGGRWPSGLMGSLSHLGFSSENVAGKEGANADDDDGNASIFSGMLGNSSVNLAMNEELLVER